MCQQTWENVEVPKTYFQACHCWKHLTKPLKVVLVSGCAADFRRKCPDGAKPALAHKSQTSDSLQIIQLCELSHHNVEEVMRALRPSRGAVLCLPAFCSAIFNLVLQMHCFCICQIRAIIASYRLNLPFIGSHPESFGLPRQSLLQQTTRYPYFLLFCGELTV